MVNVGISLFNKLHFLGWCHISWPPPKNTNNNPKASQAKPKAGPMRPCAVLVETFEKKTVSTTDLRFVYKRVFPKIGVPPKSSILIGFSLINHPFWGTPILETPITTGGVYKLRCCYCCCLKKAGQTVRNDHLLGDPRLNVFFFEGEFSLRILGVSWWFQFDDIIFFRCVGSTINYFGLFVTFESTWVGVKQKFTQSMGLGASKHLKTCWSVVV